MSAPFISKDSKIKRLNDLEALDLFLCIDFMGNQHGKYKDYQKHYESWKQGGGQMADVNPYEVLGVSKNFTWEELKSSYRRMAHLVHPDKGGSQQLFQLITDSFRTLAKDYQARHADRPHDELKKESQRFYETQMEKRAPPAYENPRMPESNNIRGQHLPRHEESFQDRFNRTFEEYKIEDDTQFGYGQFMTPSSKTREDIKIEPQMKKYNKESFNNAFEKLPTASQKIVKYKEPEALVLTKNIAFTELGDKPTDFTHQDPTTKTGLFYTDYMQAYNEGNQRLIDTSSVKRKEFKNVDEYDAYRQRKSQRPMSEKERQFQAQEKERERLREEQRLERLKQQDEAYRLQFEKLERLQLRN
jgi:curved DNA-binding protein CbpA